MAVKDYKPMQIKVLNVKKYIEQNNLPRISSTKKIGSNNTMAEEGLFSEKIFGKIGSQDRMNKMAYIELNCYCLQPYISIALERMSADFTKTTMGLQRWKIENGSLTKVGDDEGYSGLKFIYDNFELFVKTLFKENGSKVRDQNLQLLRSHKKDELFVKQWLIIPAGFRDINTLDIETKGKSDYDQINDFYSAMINISNQLENILDVDNSLVDEKFAYQMQQNINNIYRHLIEKKLAKKGGLIQKSALAKTISYSSGNVICNSKMTRNSYDEDHSNNIGFGYIGISCVHLMDMFYPFAVHRMKELFEFDENLYDIIKGKLKVKDTYTMADTIDKLIDTCKTDMKFLSSNMEYKDKKYSIKVNGKERVIKVIEFIKNEVADKIINNKFVTGTRFPVDNKLSQQYLKPKALMTEGVEKVVDDDGVEWELCNNDIIILSYMPNSHSLGPWGGDYDFRFFPILRTLKHLKIGPLLITYY